MLSTEDHLRTKVKGQKRYFCKEITKKKSERERDTWLSINIRQKTDCYNRQEDCLDSY